MIDEGRRTVEATANEKQTNLEGGYAGADDLATMLPVASLTSPPPSHAINNAHRRSGSFLDPHSDESPLNHVPLYATASQRALMTEEGCEIDMQQIKFMEQLGEGAFGKVYHCMLWEVRVWSYLDRLFSLLLLLLLTVLCRKTLQ